MMRGFDYFILGSMFVFYALFAGKTIMLMLLGQRPFVLGKKKRGFRAIFELLLMPGLLVWSIEVVAHSLRLDFHIFSPAGYPALFDADFPRIAGGVLIVAGLMLFTAALVSFGASWRVGIDRGNPGELVTGGVFAVTRNPIFVFLDLYFLGTFLIYGNLFFLAASIIAIVGNHIQILAEEKFLRAYYGSRYSEYAARVPRYLFSWRHA